MASKKGFTEFVIGLLFQGGAQMSRTPSGSAVLMAGQAYTVMVALRMPESPKNTDLVSALELHTSIRGHTLKMTAILGPFSTPSPPLNAK